MLKRLFHLILNKWVLLILIQLLIVGISYLNIHPHGYIRGGGDGVQIFNFEKFSDFTKYTWINEGEGYSANFFSYGLVYGLIGLLSSFWRVTASSQSFFYYLFFLSFSFWSFYIGISLFDPSKKNGSSFRIALSFTYAFSSFTLYAFDSGWAFTPYLYIYFLIPISFASIYIFFARHRLTISSISWLLLSTLLLLMGTQNLAFFVAIELFLGLFVGILLLFKEVAFNRSLFIRVGLYGVLTFVLLSPLIVPQFNNLLRFTNQLVYVNKTGLNDWIMWQSVPFSSLFFYLFSFDFYANQNAVPILFSVVYFGLTLLTMRSRTKNRMSLIFFILLFSALVLLNKGKGLLPPSLISLIFSNALMGALRSYDKALIFVPYFTLMTLAMTLPKLKYARFYLTTLIIISVVFNRYLFLGNLVTEHALSYKNGENYKTTKYSPIFSLPNYYYQFANQANAEGIDYKFLQIPYTVISSEGWMNLPKLQYIGIDPIAQLFDSSSVNMATFHTFSDAGTNWNYGALWNKSRVVDSEWLIHLTTFFNTRYVVYRKETEPFLIARTRSKMNYYVSKKFLTPVTSNQYFEVYKIDSSFFQPSVFAPTQILLSSASLSKLPRLVLDNPQGTNIIFRGQNRPEQLPSLPMNRLSSMHSPTIEFKKINPTKYVIRIHNATNNFPLTLSETFHEDWQATAQTYTQDPTISHVNTTSIPQSKTLDELQASPSQILTMLTQGFISSVGNLQQRPVLTTFWNDTYPEKRSIGNSTLNYISQNIRGSIQNDNLPDTTTNSKISTIIAKHFKINGYANGWFVDPNEICKKITCRRGLNGQTFELVLEFKQQPVFTTTIAFFTIALTGTVIGLIALSLYTYTKKDEKRN